MEKATSFQCTFILQQELYHRQSPMASALSRKKHTFRRSQAPATMQSLTSLNIKGPISAGIRAAGSLLPVLYVIIYLKAT